MKLHLPSSLRKALLACLAALVVPSFTVASGSALFGAALFSYLASASIASAEDISIGTRDEWDAAVDGEQNNAGNTFVINDPKNADNKFYFKNGNSTIAANLRIEEGGWTINDGYSQTNPTYTFNGSISGTGNITFDIPGIGNQTWVFAGDMSEYSGSITVTSNNENHLVFYHNTSGSGDITSLSENVHLDVRGATMKNEHITIEYLNISEGATFNVGTLSVLGAVSIADDSSDSVITFGGDNSAVNKAVWFGSSSEAWKANVTFEAGMSFTMNGALQLFTDAAGGITRTYDFGGTVVLYDNLTVYGAKNQADTAHVIFRQGASVHGNIVTGWGSLIELGDDLEFYGTLSKENDVARIARLSNATSNQVAVVYNVGEEAVESTLAEFANRFNANLEDSVAIGKSGTGTLTFMDGGSIDKSFKVKSGTVVFSEDTTINGWAGGPGTLAIASGKTLTVSYWAGGTVSKSGEGDEAATLEWTTGTQKTHADYTFAEGVKLKLNYGTDTGSWSQFSHLTVEDELILDAHELALSGTGNRINKLSSTQDMRSTSHIAIINSDLEISSASTYGGYIEFRASAALTLGGSLTVKGLITTETGTRSISNKEGATSVGLRIETGDTDFSWAGTITLDGELVKVGSGKQTIGSAEVGSLKLGGGTLAISSTSTVDGVITFDTANSTLELGGTLTAHALSGQNDVQKTISKATGVEGDVDLVLTAQNDTGIYTEKGYLKNATFSGVRLVLDFEADASQGLPYQVIDGSSLGNVYFKSEGQLELAGGATTIHGNVTNEEGVGRLVFGNDSTVEGNVSVRHLDVRGGVTATINGNLYLDGVSIQSTNWQGQSAERSIVVGGNVTVHTNKTTYESEQFTTYAGTFTMGTAESEELTFTKTGTGDQVFAGTTTLYGDVDVQAGTLRLGAGEDKGYKDKNEIGTEFSIFGNVTVDDDASFELGRGTLYLEGGTTFDGTLTVVCQTNSAYNIARLITSGTDTDAAGVTIKALDVGAGAQVLLDHPGNTDRITIQDALQLGGNITVWGTHLILSNGGTVKSGGNLNMAWQAKLELGADLELEGGFSSNTGVNLVRAESAEEEYVYLVRTVDASTGTAGAGLNIDSVYYSITYGEKTGVAVRVRDGGTKIINDWSNENLAAALRIDEGTLLLYNQPNFASNGYNVQGYLSGEGDLGVWNGAVTTDLSTYPANRQTKISGGGKLKGKLYLHEGGAYMTLASNLEVGGIRGEAVTGTAWRHIDTLGEDDYTLTLNVVDTEEEIDADVSSVSFHGNLLLRKIGGGTQRILSSTFEDSVSISVENGKLILDAANKDQLGSVEVSGSGELVFSDGSGLSGATLSGDFRWDKDVNENLGALTVGGTLYVGSYVPDESTPDPDDTIPRAGTQKLTLRYDYHDNWNNSTYLVNTALHGDIVLESGTLEIEMVADGGSGVGAIAYHADGTLSGSDKSKLILKRITGGNGAYTSIFHLDTDEDVEYFGTLAFADVQKGNNNVTLTAAEFMLGHGNYTLGSIDTTDGSGAIGFTAGTTSAAQTVDVLRAVTGSNRLRVGRSSHGANGLFANEGGAVVGVINFREGGTISGDLYIDYNRNNSGLKQDSITVNIGNGKVLSVSGLNGWGGGGIGVWNADGSATGSATLKITGTGASMANANIGSAVTLVLDGAATQTFTGSSSIDMVQIGDGMLEFEGATTLTLGRIVQLSSDNEGEVWEGDLFAKGNQRLVIGAGATEGSVIGGNLIMARGTFAVLLANDLTVGGLAVESGQTSGVGLGRHALLNNADDTTPVTLTLDVAAKYKGSEARLYATTSGSSANQKLKIGGKTAQNAGLNGNQITAARDKYFTIKKTGAGEQKLAWVDIYGELVISEGKLTFVAEQTDSGRKQSDIWGGLSGSGTLSVTAGSQSGTKLVLHELDASDTASSVGVLEILSGSTLVLDRNLTVTDLTLDTNEDNTITRDGTATTLTINVDGSTVKRGCPSMDKVDNLADSPNDWHLTLSGVKLEKTGSGTYSISGLEMDQSLTVKEGRLEVGNSTIGGVQIDAGASLLARYSLADGRKTVIGGTLSGSGTLMVSNTDLELTSTDEHTFSGRLDMNWASHLLLASDLEVSGMISSLGQNASEACVIKLYGSTTEAVFTLNVTDATPVDFRYSGNNANISKLKVESGIKLVKTGSGTQVFYDFGANNVEITEGALRLNVGTYDNLAWGGLSGGAQGTSSYVVNNVLVAGEDAALEIGKRNWNANNGTEGEGTNIKLKDGGTLRSVWAPTGNAVVASNINIGTITLAAESVEPNAVDARFEWSASALGVNTTEDWTIYKLTGTGNLVLGDATGNGEKKLTFGTITDYEGVISGGSGASVYISSVHQTSGAGSITTDVRVARDTAFRKTGAGSFSLSHLTVETMGHVYMDYEGTLSVTDLEIMSGAYLHYTTGVDANGLLHWTADKLEALMHSDGSGAAGGVYLDISDMLNDDSKLAQLESGICLGITGRVGRESEEALAALKGRLRMASGLSSGADFGLRWGDDDYLYLYVTSYTPEGDNPWDTRWGLELVNGYPDSDDLEANKITADDLQGKITGKDPQGEFNGHALELAGSGYGDGIASHYIKLTDGDTADDTKLSIIGGKLYDSESAAPGNVTMRSFIMLEPEADKEGAHYHMLVGGSALVNSAAGTGSFVGTSHIEMKGGVVDYIVGGNHVTNREMAFTGNSYISVDGGTVLGSIVGGSTLTRGAAEPDPGQSRDAIEFNGNSNINIYTVLGNGRTTPAITTGTVGAEHVAFTAVVGGNAWIELPGDGASGMAPLFMGSSKINIVLDGSEFDMFPGEERSGEFAKAIVGGNYTAAFAGSANNSDRSTRFVKEGDYVNYGAQIVIRATDDVEFSGGVNGASRRSSGGAGETYFEGNTLVEIHGGTYTNIVAGGLWFDESAAGAHSSQFFGNTLVQINSGNLWRVVGGSVSLGGSGSTSEAEDSNTQVLISGGSFANKPGSGAEGALTQADIGFVVGGDLYKNTGTYGTANDGSGHVRTGNTNVTITGGTFTDMHIVGGDYANFTASGSEYGPVINGTSTVTIGGEGSVTISGLVVGGSYLTDEGQNGQVTINGTQQGDGSALATHLVIAEGASVSKGAEDSGHTHGDIAVVAGHVMIDEKVGGGHLAHISGDTWVEVTGGEVHGVIVGGSYTSASGGTNTLSIDGTSRIDLTGGVIDGGVVGGHYSENTESPDALSLGDVTITLNGAAVTGNIIGGSHRAAEKALGEAPTQKNITINLVSGSLTGNVYAAGEHVGAAVDGTLNVTTESTTVNVGANMVIGAGTVVSGGYAKAAPTAQDASTVTGAAKLVIEGDDANLSGVHFVDFSHVVNEQDVKVTGRFSVLDRGADTRLTKQGAGHLSLSQGLTAADGGAYAGAIELSKGTLSVGKDLNLASVSTLAIDLTGRTLNTKDTAWLSAESGAKLLVESGSITKVELTYSGDELGMGTYYLTSELNGGDLGMTGAEDYFSQLVEADLAKLGVVKDSLKAKLQLLNNCLVLRVSSDNPDEWYWEGGVADEDKVWDNSSSDNWTRDIDGGMDAEQTHQDVHFNGGAAGGDVHIAGKVTPANVFIESGSFTFSQKEDAETGGMELDAGGILYVGVGTDDSGFAPDASLELALKNTRIPKVQLNEGGVLILSHAEAVQAGEGKADNEKTKIDFNGGVLVYGENADGTLAFTQDLSSHVLEVAGAMNSGDWEAKNQNGGIIRLQIGNSADAPAAMSAREVSEELPTVVWNQASSGTATNYGIERILSAGIEKSGRGTLEVVWSVEANDQHYSANVISATEGRMVFDIRRGAPATALVRFGVSNIDMLPIQVSGTGSVQFMASSGITLVMVRSFEGDGTVALGNAAGGDGFYLLASDNSGFKGTIELVGNGTSGCVNVGRLYALHADRLLLNGRGFAFLNEDAQQDREEDGMHVSTDVVVVDGTENYIGNAHGATMQANSISAKIHLDGSVSGGGTLVSSSITSHFISGDISDFTGTLKVSNTTSKWTLLGDKAPDTVQAHYVGEGSIYVDYDTEKAVRLAGQFSDKVNLYNMMEGGKVVLAAGADKLNTSRGALVFNNSEIQLGDEKAAGTWTGGTLQLADGADSGTFRLVSGTLYGGITADGKGAGVQLVAETSERAATRVNVGGTQGSLFDAITVNQDGYVSGVSGNITAGEGSGKTKVKLVLGELNIGSTSSSNADDFLLGMQNGGSLIIDAQSTGFGLEFSSYALVKALLEMRTAEMAGSSGEAYLHLVTGGNLEFSPALEDALRLMARNAPNGYTGLLADLGFQLAACSASPGEMLLMGSSKDVYLVLGDDDARGDDASVTKENKDKIEGKKATVVGPNATLDVTLDGADSAADPDDAHLTVRNLVGVENSTLHGHRTEGTEGDATIQLDNTYISDSLDDTGMANAGVPGEDARGQNTMFEGTIIGDEGVNFEKTGKGKLTVGNGRTGKGGTDIQGKLTLSEGSLSMEGYLSDREESGNFVGALEFNYETPIADDEERGFTFRNGATTTTGILESGAYSDDNVVNLEQDGELVFAGEPGSTLKSTRFVSSDGSGTLSVTQGDLMLDSSELPGSSTTRVEKVNVEVGEEGHLHLAGGSEMKNSSASVQGEFTLSGGSAINGRSDVSVAEGGQLTLSDGSRLDTTGSVDVQGTLTVTSGSELHANNGATVDGVLNLDTSQNNTVHGLTGKGTLAGNEADLTLLGADNEFGGTLSGKGHLTVDANAELVLDNVVGDSGTGRWDLENRGSLTVDVTKGVKTRLGDLLLADDSETTLLIDSANSGGGVDLSSLSWEEGAILAIESVSPSPFIGDSLDLGFVASAPEGTGLDLRLKGVAFLHYEAGELYRDASGRLKLELFAARENLFYSSNMSKNEIAGADLFWNASDPRSGKWRALTADFKQAMQSDLYKMVDSLTAMVQEGKTEGLGRTLAAGAGASVSVLGMALSQDIQRQLSTVRNRTTTMTPEPRYDAYEQMPYYHVWMNGEGSYHKLKAEGMAPGYSLNSWGGTLGADADVSRSTTVGLALTAMYGDLKAEAADSARGDLDTWYLSAFARVAQGAWMHTFVMSGGLADVKLNRTVNYGQGSYSTKGSTTGSALAAMYELGYAQVLDSEGAAVLQSVFNVTYRHATVNGYTETGSDAGLRVGDISHDVVTVGAGARLQAVMGQNAFNRTSILEGRVLVKGDMGDHSGTATNQLINGDGLAREVESAKVGTVGVEIGVGLTIPVGGLSGTIFMDASVEFRRGYTSMDANVGYRYNF